MLIIYLLSLYVADCKDLQSKLIIVRGAKVWKRFFQVSIVSKKLKFLRKAIAQIKRSQSEPHVNLLTRGGHRCGVKRLFLQ